MSSPRYTFLSPFWFSEGWWRDEYNATAGNPYEVCSSEELAVMLDHSIAIEYFPEPTANELSLPTDVGLVSVSSLCVAQNSVMLFTECTCYSQNILTDTG